jgi:hypothetical protein
LFRSFLSTLAFAGFLAAAYPILADPAPEYAQAKAFVPNQAASAQPMHAERVSNAPVGLRLGRGS